MDQIFENIGKSLRAAGFLGKISVNSALNPLLWLVGIFLIFLSITFIFGKIDGILLVVFTVMLAVILLCTL